MVLFKSKKAQVVFNVLIVLLILIAIISLALRLAGRAQAPSYLEPKYLVCLPFGGIMDKCHKINVCIEYAKKYNRVVIIESSTDWFNDDINEYINIHCPYVYTGAADTIIHKISKLSSYPAVNIEKLDEVTEKKIDGKLAPALNNKSLHIDMSRDYKERVLVYSNNDYGFGFISLLEMSTIAPKVLEVYKARRARLPEKYIGVHIRNTDYDSDVPGFIEENKNVFYNAPIFLASDNKNTIDTLKQTYGSNLYSFANIVDNGGKPLHVDFKRTKAESLQYNIDTFVDILLLASADNYYFSCKKSGFSKTIYELRKKPALIKRLLA